MKNLVAFFSCQSLLLGTNIPNDIIQMLYEFEIQITLLLVTVKFHISDLARVASF